MMMIIEERLLLVFENVDSFEGPFGGCCGRHDGNYLSICLLLNRRAVESMDAHAIVKTLKHLYRLRRC
jgi:hypothetical protein